MHHLLPYSDSCLYWCLAYIREGTTDLRIYVAVTSPYSWNRGVTSSLTIQDNPHTYLRNVIWKEELWDPRCEPDCPDQRPDEQTRLKQEPNLSFLIVEPCCKNWYFMTGSFEDWCFAPTTSTISILSLFFLHRMKKKNDIATRQRKECGSKNFLDRKISRLYPRAPLYL